MKATSLAALTLFALAAHAQTVTDNDPVLASNATAEVRLSDLKGELARFPAEQHYDFLSSRARAAKMIENILVNKTLAARAKAKALDKDPMAQLEIRNQTERILARTALDADERSLALPDFRGRARELYLTNPADYTPQTVYEIEQILVDSRCRTATAAKEKAREIREEILAGKITFAEAARKHSDDTGSRDAGGKLEPSPADRFLATIGEVVKSIKVGEISEPVVTQFGAHIVRVLKATPGKIAPFEAVMPGIVEKLRQQALKDHREGTIGAIRSDPAIKVNNDAIDAARNDTTAFPGAKRPG